MGLLLKRRKSKSSNSKKKSKNSNHHQHQSEEGIDTSFQSSTSNYTSRPSEDLSIASGPSILNMSRPKSNTVHRIVSPTNKSRKEINNDNSQIQSTTLNNKMRTPRIIEPEANGTLDQNDFAIHEFGNDTEQSLTQDPGIAINIMRQSSRETANNLTKDSQGQYLQAPNKEYQSSSSNSSMNNTSQTTQTTVPPENPKESGGIISSFLTAAANKMSSTAIQFEDKEKKKEHSIASKIDSFIKSVKHEENPDTSKTTGQSADSESNTPKQIRNSTELKSLHSAQNVQFEPIKESPLNTLGNGDLTLDDFEHFTTQNAHPQQINPTPINAQTVIPNSTVPNTSSDIQRNVSPDSVNKSLPQGNQLQAMSNGTEVKRVHRLSINGSAPERQVSNGRNSIVDIHATTSSNGNATTEDTKNTTQSKTTEETEDTSGSEKEDLDNVIDYSKKIKHATEKSNEEFHSTFKKIPKKDKLIEEISCALSKDILVQGKMYLSDHYVCFNSNILGWIKKIVIPLSEVIQIEKRSTAGLFPNGMVIKTLHQKYTFASIIGRDSVFSLITNVWHRVLLENSDVDPKKLRKAARSRAATMNSMSSNGSQISSEGSESDDDATGGSGEDDDNSSGDESDDDDEDNEEDGEKGASGGGGAGGGSSGGDGEFNGLPLLGPATHAPTETGYEKSSDDTFIAEEILKAPPGVIYLLLFGQNTSYFIRILKEQKNFDIDESEIHGINKENKDRHYTYIKPLGGSIGPKQTKCIIDDQVIEYNPEKYYEVEQTTQTPDVPSGNSFKVKTKIFLSWAEKNQTKIYVVTSIEWSGKSWIKGAIEKGTIDGQKDSMKDMIETLNQIISEGGSGGSGKKSGSTNKRRSTRSRRNTEKKSESEVKPKEEAPKSIPDQTLTLIKSIGELIPIPMIDSTIVGTIVVLIGFFLLVFINNKINGFFFHKEDDYKSKIYCDAERDVWEWIISRSNEKLSNSSS